MSSPFDPEQFRRAAELLRQAQPQLKAAQDQLRQAEPQVRAVQKAIADSERAMGRTLQEMASWHAEAMRSLEATLDQVAQWYPTFETGVYASAVPILRRRGWFGLAPHIDSVEVLNYLTVHRKKGSAASDRFICRLFAKNNHRKVRSLTRAWWRTTYLTKRRRHVLAALAAYRAGKHSLAISALLPLVDGLAAVYVRKNPTLIPRRTGRQPIIVVDDVARLHTERRPDYADLLIEAVTQKIYARYKFGSPAPSTLNRHGILHGDILGGHPKPAIDGHLKTGHHT